MNIIEVKDLSYVYAKGTTYEQRALNNVSISVKKGEILVYADSTTEEYCDDVLFFIDEENNCLC